MSDKVYIEVPKAMMEAALDDEFGDDITVLTNFVLEEGAAWRAAVGYVEEGLCPLAGLTLEGVYAGVLRDQITFYTVEKGPITFLASNGSCTINVFGWTNADVLVGRVKSVHFWDDKNVPTDRPYYSRGHRWAIEMDTGFIAEVFVDSSYSSSLHPSAKLEHAPREERYRLAGDSLGTRRGCP